MVLKLAIQQLWKAVLIFKRTRDVFCPQNQLAGALAQSIVKSV